MEARFAAIFVALYVAHNIGDYWVQTDWQARTKSLDSWMGRIACGVHVATYTATILGGFLVVHLSIDIDLSPARMAVALGLSAITHYIADRRSPLRRIALWARHDRSFLDCGGLALVDQAWHIAWLWVAALILT